MSAFYGMICGNRGAATRGGSKNSGYKASAQSYDGSVITYLDYDQNGELTVQLSLSDHSSSYGDTMFRGTFKELQESLQLLKDIKSGKVSVTRHRDKSNKMKQLEKIFG